MHEVQVPLNVNEIGVLLSALQLLECGDENRIAKHYGSVPSLYNRLVDAYNQLDQEHLVQQDDPICEPSF